MCLRSDVNDVLAAVTYTASPAVLQACGTRVLPLQSVTTLPYGGKQYNYEQPDGRMASLSDPPASFNSATASPSELEAFGVPPEPPASSPEYPKWKAMIVKGIHFVPPSPTLDEVPANPLAASQSLGKSGLLENAASLASPASAGEHRGGRGRGARRGPVP